MSVMGSLGAYHRKMWERLEEGSNAANKPGQGIYHAEECAVCRLSQISITMRKRNGSNEQTERIGAIMGVGCFSTD